MSTAGIFNTSNFAPDQEAKSFASMIMTKFPGGQATLFGLSSRLQNMTAKQRHHAYYHEYMLFPQLTITQSLPAASPGDISTINVTGTDGVIVGQIFEVNGTGEQVLLVGVPGPTQVVLQRGVGLNAPAVGATGSILLMVGNAYEESSLRPLALAMNPKPVFNFTQIFRNTWGVSGSVEATSLMVGEAQPAKSRKDAALFHAVDIEKAFLFGERYEGVRNGQPFRKMDGLVSSIKQYAPNNVSIAGATTTYDQLEAMLDSVFDITTDPGGPNDRLLLVGSKARKVLNTMGRYSGTVFISDGQTSFGLQFSRFKIARGEFVMLEHPLFNTNPVWQKMAIAVDLSSMRPAYLGNRKTQYRAFNSNLNGDSAETQDNGIDAKGGTFTTEVTAEIATPEANAVIYNLTAAACVECLAQPTSYDACFTVDVPCAMGKVDEGDTVTLTITGAAPSDTVSVAGPSGIITITTDSDGNGTEDVVIGGDPTYAFTVLQTAGQMNTTFSPSIQYVCVNQVGNLPEGMIPQLTQNDPDCPTDVPGEDEGPG